MNLGIKVEVVGQIIPYSFANEETGELIGLVHLRVPGDVVSVNVDPDIAKKMREGETWRVRGTGVVRKKSGKLVISPAESLERVGVAANAAGPTVNFGDDAKLAASKN